MTDKENLIELLGKDTCKHDCCLYCEHNKDHDTCITYLKNSMADLLIANGVTFQKWIPVAERFPEQCEYVIGWTKYSELGEVEYDGKYFVWAYTEDVAHATHWMPLPEPPVVPEARCYGKSDSY